MKHSEHTPNQGAGETLFPLFKMLNGILGGPPLYDPNERQFFTIQEFAEITGVMPITLQSWCRRGILKATQPGDDPNLWLICRTNIDDWKRQCQLNQKGGYRDA